MSATDAPVNQPCSMLAQDSNGELSLLPLVIPPLAEFCDSHEISVDEILRLTWSVVLAIYTGSSDVRFRCICPGSSSDEPKLEQWVHLMNVDRNTAIINLVKRMPSNSSYHNSQQSMAAEQELALDGCDTLFMHNVGPGRGSQMMGKPHIANIRAILEVNGSNVTLAYRQAKLGNLQAKSMATAITRIITTLIDQPWTAVADFDFCDEDDMKILQTWNNFEPTLEERCVHDLISKQATERPNSPAVDAWDGQFTYHELDSLATDLAVYLTGLGIIPETFVALCFEKSKWLTVSILAVIKTGAAYVVIEPYYPLSRMQGICAQLHIDLLVTSQDLFQTASNLSDHVVVVSEGSEYFESHCDGEEKRQWKSPSSAHNALYVVFSSGSTGNPKGIVVEHGQFVSWGTLLRESLGLDDQSRVLQFSSFAFLIAHRDVLLTLMLGGCVCMPSEAQRLNHLETFMTEYNVNWANLTPSVAALLDPDMTPSLKTLLLTSEPMSLCSLATWEGRVNLMFAYGQAESVSLCCVRKSPTVNSDRKNVGHRIGRSIWLVDPEDHNKLVPLGAVGELVIEGPVLARGYLDAERTALAFLDDAKWLQKLKPGYRGRLYKTGDLGQFADDGSVRFLSRKDNSTKIYGQRLDLDEVTRHIQRCLAEMSDTAVHDVVVDLCYPPSSNDIKLTAFLGLTRTSTNTDSVTHLGPLDRAPIYLQELGSRLTGLVPRYMVPTLVVTISCVPLNLSGKTDRRRLRELLSQMTCTEVALCMGSNTSHEAPRTEQERTLSLLWSQTLNVAQSSIGRQDDFFRRGGDSLAAMKLVSAAHAAGVSLVFGDIFTNPSLVDQASLIGRGQEQIQEFHPCGPFELITESRKRVILAVAAKNYALSESNIEDIYPTTPIQEGLIALNTVRPGSYMSQRVYAIQTDVSCSRFEAAWKATLDANPPLRTRVIRCPDDGGTYQIVVRDELDFSTHPDLNEYLAQDRTKSMDLGVPLVRLSLITSGDGRPNFCVITIHHCIYDGWSMSVLLRQVEAAYHGAVLVSQPFREFVKYVHQSNKKASEYWKAEMVDVRAEQFPALPSTTYCPKTTERESLDIRLPASNAAANITLSTRIQLAWAVTLASYTRLTDVVFGLTVSGRGSPVPGIDKMAGPTIATFPLRVQLNFELSTHDMLRLLHSRIISGMPFEHFGVQNISRVGNDAATACSFQSLLVIQQSPNPSEETGILSSVEGVTTQQMWDTYALTIVCTPAQDGMIHLEAIYDPAVIPQDQTRRTIHVFANIMRQIVSFPERLVGDIDGISDEDMRQLQVWNGSVPPTVSRCVHDMIHEQCLSQPEAIAIDAWDGQLTYHQLDAYSSGLSAVLTQEGLQADMFVPLCFEKSKWVAVAILAVAKAGGAFILLDPSHPAQRLAWICKNAHATMVLCSKHMTGLATQLNSQHVIPVDEKYMEETQGPTGTCKYQPNQIPANHTLCAIYTSGSTGTPKGVAIEHAAFATQITALGPYFNLNNQSRIFQFASHAFDAAVADYLFGLALGGCVCIPKESESRNNLAGAISERRANWSFLTPSVARTLMPETLHDLKVLVIGGEPPRATDFTAWSRAVNLVTVYGPAECTVYSTLLTNIQPNANPANIGSGVTAACWIVDPNNPERLVVIGAIGELLIEGPLVGRSYLGDEALSRASFIPPPRWLLALQPRHQARRLYRTGDLVRYSPIGDGSLEFVGRKDNQVKIRGQRLELGEIERQVTGSFPMATDAIVDVITPSGLDNQKLLVAFIWDAATATEHHPSPNPGTLPESNIFVSPDSAFRHRAAAAEVVLRNTLPAFMVPSLYIPLRQLPLAPTGKTNRRLIKEQACLFSREELAVYQGFEPSMKMRPSNELEGKICQLVADVLGLSSNDVGMNDNFFQLGGDSISAMTISARATDSNLALTVADILSQPQLQDMASLVIHHNGGSGTSEAHPPPPPFSLLPTHCDRDDLMHEVTQQCNTDRDSIEDIYPCTPLQEGLFALSLKHPGAYVFRFTLELTPDIDLDCFQNAWDFVVQTNSILRTRIVCATGMGANLVQVVMREASYRQSCPIPEPYPIALGGPLFSIEMLAPEKNITKYRAVVTIHHALYDGVSLALILNQLSVAYYNGERTTSQPYSCFIQHSLSLPADDQIRRFWHAELAHAAGSSLRAASTDSYSVQAPKYTEYRISLPSDTKVKAPLSAALKLAWGLVLSRFTGENDAVFGTVVSGRMSNLRGIHSITGPTIATVPFRVRPVPSMTIQEALDEVQSQSLRMIPFEQTGLQRIRKLGYADACRFQSILIIQFPGENIPEGPLYKLVQEGPARAFHTYPLTIECTPSTESVYLRATFDSAVIPTSLMDRLLAYYSHILMYINSMPRRAVSSIPSQSTDDIRRVWAWNENVPRREDTCIHDIITSNLHKRPGASAVCAWDGELTYTELEDMSTRLAAHLTSVGVGQGAMVPLCFEKSRWAIVAILAVLKAGGAFVPLDASQAAARRETILARVGAKVILASAKHVSTLAGSNGIIIPVNDVSIGSLPTPTTTESTATTHGQASSAAYVFFTSGSTGQPKGVVVNHDALSTSCLAHGLKMGFSEQTRILQFTSYTFDISLMEILTTLVYGGCVCVPSDADRFGNLELSAEVMQVNTLSLTASVARLVEPCRIPALKTIIFVGENATDDDFKRWARLPQIFDAYGPTECTIFCSINQVQVSENDGSSIGTAVGSVTWVVSPDDHNQLAPIGAVGELLVEGPVLAQGYLGDAEKTSAVFVEDPPWLVQGIANYPGRRGRLYKTGDLVRYNEDGSLVYLGRKDTQIKIRGHRVELGEVECHVRDSVAGVTQAVVVAIAPDVRDAGLVLVAFLCFGDSKYSSESDARAIAIPQSIKDTLAERLPAYMIPSVYLSVRQLPLNTSGKMDRRHLQDIATYHYRQRLTKGAMKQAVQDQEDIPEGRGFQANDHPPQSITALSSPPSTFRDCFSETQRRLRTAWASILGLQSESISVDDNFYEIGGDSLRIISLMRFVQTEFDTHLGLSMINSRNTTIAKMAEFIESGAQEDPTVDLEEEIVTGISSTWTTVISQSWFTPVTLGHAPATVFLTGGTGFLGTQILHCLLTSDTVQNVVALVRAASAAQGLERVKQTATAVGWWKPEYEARIEIWVGDLEQSRLGLGDSQWRRLSGRATMGNVDAIIHNGAVVNWNMDYDKLRAPNVLSTVQLLEVAVLSPHSPRFVFVSGGAIAELHGNVDSHAVMDQISRSNGYCQSKYVAESIVHRFASLLPLSQNRFSVIKPGMIIGTADHGVANLDDFLWRVVATAARLRLYPLPTAESWVPITDAGFMAAQTVTQILANNISSYINAATKFGLRASEFWGLVNSELKQPCETVPWGFWVERALEDTNHIGESHPLWPVQQFLRSRSPGGISIPSPLSSPDPEGLCQAVKANVRHLGRVGYLECRPRKGLDEQPGIFHRSTAIPVSKLSTLHLD
ncbi:hypothetical protein BDV25DRAFT_143253 [Aspergillus avenaceus]|uniref:Carrier domain-containing protein n=1 Tax=Aspergillus avenaceus TaxID=36643 RepID=A0A5N6TKK3_ASPAV|nr:hypothetical protein BDV25DRAFT_143253 [Aspergillus avenaceus]